MHMACLAVLQLLLVAGAGSMKPNAQFERMLSSVRVTPAELACIDKPRVRTVLKGVDAVLDTPSIKQAFQTIYEDLAMLRPAGNLAVRQLAAQCQTARERASHLTRMVGRETDANELLPLLRQYFEAIDVTSSGRLAESDLRAACGGAAGPGAAALANACLQEECELEVVPAVADRGPTFEEFVMLIARRQLDLDMLDGIAGEGAPT